MITPYTAQPVTFKLWSYLPTFVQESDAANTYQFLTWLDGIGQQLQPITDLIRDTGAVPGWSIVMDLSRCPAYALPWLGQFVGTRFPTGNHLTATAMRQQILALGALARGTPNAIILAIQAVVGKTAMVRIIERYPDPYTFRVVITGGITGLTYAELAREYPLYSEVASAFPTYDDFPTRNTAAIAAALAAATPGGLLSTFVITEG